MSAHIRRLKIHHAKWIDGPVILRPLGVVAVRRLRRGRVAAAAVCALILLGACSSNSVAESTAPTEGSAAARTGTESSALRRIDQAALRETVTARAREMLVPGTVALLKTPSGSYVVEYGTTERGGGRPVSIEDYVRIGSNTKTWTGTVILQLMAEEKLSLADPVSRYRPDVPNGENITIEQLLAMRSGLYNYSDTVELNQDMDDNPTRVWKPEQLLKIAFKHDPYFLPGEGYHYSNTNTILLGLIAEQLEGEPLSRIFQKRLFEPLGLEKTVFPDIQDASIPEPHPRGYMYGSNISTINTGRLPPKELAAAKEGTLAPADYTDANPSWGWSAGAGISTAGDLLRWVEALTGTSDPILDQKLTDERLASVQSTDPGDPQAAGYGWNIAQFGPMYGHTGELPGFNTFAASDPASKVTLVVWTNLGPEPVHGGGPAVTIARALLPLIYVNSPVD